MKSKLTDFYIATDEFSYAAQQAFAESFKSGKLFAAIVQTEKTRNFTRTVLITCAILFTLTFIVK